MKHLILALLPLLLVIACSDEGPRERQPGQTLITSNPMSQVQAEIDKDPNNADAWFHLADLYERSGMYPEEADALSKVISLEPGRGYVYLKLGNTYNRMEKYPEAVTQFHKARKFLPKDPVLYNNMAFALGKTGKTDEQIAALKKAISLRPRYSTARYNLAMVYLRKGQVNAARRQYEEINAFDEGVASSLKKEIDAAGK